MVHELKIDKAFFGSVETGVKPFEVRKNDRDFKAGDVLALNEVDNLEYTGRHTLKVITYVLDDSRYVKEGYVILGLADRAYTPPVYPSEKKGG